MYDFFFSNSVTSNRQSKRKANDSAWLKWRHFICRVCMSTVSESHRRWHQLHRNFLANLKFLEFLRKSKTDIYQMMMILLIFNDSFQKGRPVLSRSRGFAQIRLTAIASSRTKSLVSQWILDMKKQVVHVVYFSLAFCIRKTQKNIFLLA